MGQPKNNYLVVIYFTNVSLRIAFYFFRKQNINNSKIFAIFSVAIQCFHSGSY